MNLKNFHNNGSNIFSVIDIDTKKLINKIKIDRNKSFDLLKIEDKFFRIVGIFTGGKNKFEVKELENFNLKPGPKYHFGNIFYCPYCSSQKIRENNYDKCLICKSKSSIEKIIVNIDMPFVDVWNNSNRLFAKKNKLYVNNLITPKRRSRILEGEIV